MGLQALACASHAATSTRSRPTSAVSCSKLMANAVGVNWQLKHRNDGRQRVPLLSTAGMTAEATGENMQQLIGPKAQGKPHLRRVCLHSPACSPPPSPPPATQPRPPSASAAVSAGTRPITTPRPSTASPNSSTCSPCVASTLPASSSGVRGKYTAAAAANAASSTPAVTQNTTRLIFEPWRCRLWRTVRMATRAASLSFHCLRGGDRQLQQREGGGA